jgi:hypothetical protein
LVAITVSFALLCFALLCFALLCFALLCFALLPAVRARFAHRSIAGKANALDQKTLIAYFILTF